jgi:CBS domain-containing protein/gamma-glutamylcysteine synthetase
MGDQHVSKMMSAEEKQRFTRYLLNDLKALDYMLRNDMFEKGIQRIGAEQEICLIDEDWRPAMTNVEILREINDPHWVPEIARFNLEVNLEPHEFTGSCFSDLRKELDTHLKKGRQSAKKHNSRILLTGILPTIRRQHLHFEYMTPNPRYEALNDGIRQQRGSDFELNIAGTDELITRHPNILFEACNTSFQVHLQIAPEDFVDQYNWSQLIAAPVLAAASNSPVLMGRRLWSETRIALFQQSVDTRSSSNLHREKEARVSFGKQWLKGSVSELFKDNISRFNLLIAVEDYVDSMEELNRGKIPDLKALRIHNSTVYRWNRACYGVGGGVPHLRIENRYIPSGPTVIDEIANAAFWLGLMVAMPNDMSDIESRMSFEDARYNFNNASRTCIDAQFRWFGETVSAGKLIQEELLPMAKKGLKKMGVHSKDIRKYLGVIENRMYSHTNGSKWALKNFSELLIGSTPNEACQSLTEKMYENHMSGKPVHEWENVEPDNRDRYKQFKTVGQIMETDLYTVNEEDLVELVINMMDWKNIRHIPVENQDHDFMGMIGSRDLIRYFTSDDKDSLQTASQIMQSNTICVEPDCSTSEAIELMAKERLECLPVVSENRLVGLITESDIVQVAKMTGRFK